MDGYVGIGITNSTQKLDANENIAVSGTTVHTFYISLKNIFNLNNSLSKLIQLNGV